MTITKQPFLLLMILYSFSILITTASTSSGDNIIDYAATIPSSAATDLGRVDSANDDTKSQERIQDIHSDTMNCRDDSDSATNTCMNRKHQDLLNTNASLKQCQVHSDTELHQKHYHNTKFSSSIYEYGGSAQAYKPNAPIQSEICKSDNNMISKRWKVAKNSVWRSMQKGNIPKVIVKGRIFVCPSNNDASSISIPIDNNNFYLHVWQTKPDGTYSSLVPGKEEGICRARVPIIPQSSSSSSTAKSSSVDSYRFEFVTLAPGSTGILQGLGPNQFDSPPWKQPVIHLLFAHFQYKILLAEILIDIPRLHKYSKIQNDNQTKNNPNHKTVEVYNYQTSSTTDYHRNDPNSIQIHSYRIHKDTNEIIIDVDLYLHPSQQQQRNDADPDDEIQSQTNDKQHTVLPVNLYSWMTRDLKHELCPSKASSSSSSRRSWNEYFFQEPIAICSPYLFDFFTL